MLEDLAVLSDNSEGKYLYLIRKMVHLRMSKFMCLVTKGYQLRRGACRLVEMNA